MYSAIVADDEEIIRKGITGFLDTDETIQVVASAEDGLDALEKTVELLPDMIFVDINMPHMNGLELIEKLGNLEKEILVIVVTGYSDFAYAQRALRLGVFDYFLKPVMEEPFFKLLDKAKGFIDEQRMLNLMQDQLKDTVEFAAERCLNLYSMGFLGLEDCTKRLAFLSSSLAFPAELYVFYGKIPPEPDRADEAFAAFLPGDFRNETNKFFPDAPVSFISHEGRIVYIHSGENPDLSPVTERFQVEMKRRTFLDISELCRAYRDILEGAKRETHYTPQVQKALEYIRENYADPGLSLTLISEAAHVSAGHLGRLFRRELYRSPIDYLNGYRIERSMELLLRKDWKIYEIAEKTGFTSQHYFSNAFKKYAGQSPKAYRMTGEVKC